MSFNFMEQPTLRGFKLGEVASAMQKAIRRGQEEQAVAWAAELDQSGFGTYMWKRLVIITSEDVGVAWPEGPAVIAALRNSYDQMIAGGKRGGSERIFATHAVMLLARAKKSRRVDAAIWATYGHAEPWFTEIPDEALDFHTRRGRELGRLATTKKGLDHWYGEASLLVNEDPDATDGPYEERYKTSDDAAFSRQITPRTGKPAETTTSLFDE